jgi:C-terminal processing protease CtpA/Prc
MKIRIYIILLTVCLCFSSCFEDNDDKIYPASTLDIQNFIYRGLNYYYLYKADHGRLADDAFENQKAKERFFGRFESPEALFNALKSDQDRFSQLFNDYTVIENALGGVTMSNGMEYGLVQYPDNSGNVFGYVRYVLPNTDAEILGLKRGDIFTAVNGTQLNENNYNDLLSNDSYSINLANYNGNVFVPTGEQVLLNKIQYDENPVFISRTLNINGQKVGYLMYTSFTLRYDAQLNDVFARFKADGITDLILDLRYNGGGAVETATDLASMITGQFNGEIFYKEYWNADRQTEYAKDGLFDNHISNGSPINSLNLGKVYILTSKRTASASELVINGLKPYINTIQVGDHTTGKFQASFLLYDAPAPQFSRNQASLSHKYVMLPLVFKTANKVGNTDFVDGLSPNIVLKENYFNLGELGNPEEPLLAAALNDIFGLPRDSHRDFYELSEISGSERNSPLHEIMIAERD